MAFDLDISFGELTSRKAVNENLYTTKLSEVGREHLGCIVAISDGVIPFSDQYDMLLLRLGMLRHCLRHCLRLRA
jgi:hypothetical protein